MNIDWNSVINGAIGWLRDNVLGTGVKIIIALVILLVSFRIITVVCRRFEKRLVEGRAHADKTVSKTLFHIISIALKVVVVVCLIGYLGIDTSGLTALIASLGVTVGLAVNGAVGNFAGGILIILTRPFKVDDFIETCDVSGTVEDIRLINTRIRTTDNKVIYLPNGTLSSSTIINYSEKDMRRVDFTFSIAYENDFEAAKAIIMEILNSHESVLKLDEKMPFVRMSAHGPSSIDIAARVWVKSGDYWTVYHDVLETVKKTFDEKGISIPYNQIDVHVKKD